MLLLLYATLGLAQEPTEAEAPPVQGAPAGDAPTEGAADELPPLVKNPEIVKFVEATWPEGAREAGLEAVVRLLVDIDEAGAVTAVEVLEPAGSGFDEAAVAAVRQFVFSPAEDETGPVPVQIEFAYGFVLDAASVEGAVPEASEAPVEGEAPPAGEAPVNLDGVVVEMGTRRPLPGIAVRVEPLGLEVTTGDDGTYAFRGVPAGTVTLRVVHPGYESVEREVTVSEGEATAVKVWLRNLNAADQGIVGTYRREVAEVTQHTISMDEIRRIPGTFGDPIRVVQTLPGAARAPFGTGLLIIRGANPQDSAVYVDGIRIPYIYHLGGFESVINPDLVAAVDYLPGGYGVEYGRTLGGSVEARTRTEFPERIKVAWSTDALDSGGSVMGRVGKKKQHAFGLAARRSYIDALLPLFIKNPDLVVKPVWWDYQAKYQYVGDGADELSVLAFGFRDDLLASAPPGFATTDATTQGDLGTSYYTHRVVLNWEHPITDTLHLRLVPSVGRDWARLSVGDGLRVEQGQWIAEVRAELPWKPSDHFLLRPGIDFIGGFADFVVELPFDPSSLAETDPLAEADPYSLSDTQTGWGPDPYVEAEIRPLADPDALLLVPGVRFTYINIPGELAAWGFDPRLTAKWSFLEKSTVKGSVGLYHQPPQPFQSYRPDEERVELLMERAVSASLGFEQQVGMAIHGSAELFYRWSDHLIEGNPEFNGLDGQYFVNSGQGRAYGVELLLRHDPVGKFFGWISYTLSRSERRESEADDWYLFDFDQTHILVANGGYKLPFDIGVSAQLQYVTGNPTTPYSLGVYDIDQDSYSAFSTGARNSERLPDYFALNARIDKLFTFKAWQLELYVDLLNLVRGKNPEFELYNYDYTESTYIRGLPFIPSPGFEAKFEF